MFYTPSLLLAAAAAAAGARLLAARCEPLLEPGGREYSTMSYNLATLFMILVPLSCSTLVLFPFLKFVMSFSLDHSNG